MSKELEKLVDKIFKVLNQKLSEGRYDHVYIVDTNIVHGFPEALKILAQEGRETSNGENHNIIILSDVVRRELNGLKKSDSGAN